MPPFTPLSTSFTPPETSETFYATLYATHRAIKWHVVVWFGSPSYPCTTFCTCQRYGQNIYFQISLHTPCIMLARHYSSLIWNTKNCWFFARDLLVCFGSVLQLTWTTFTRPAGMGIIFTSKYFCTPLVVFWKHTIYHSLGCQKTCRFLAKIYLFVLVLPSNSPGSLVPLLSVWVWYLPLKVSVHPIHYIGDKIAVGFIPRSPDDFLSGFCLFAFLPDLNNSKFLSIYLVVLCCTVDTAHQ